MKKILMILMTTTMLFTLVACGEKDEDAKEPPKASTILDVPGSPSTEAYEGKSVIRKFDDVIYFFKTDADVILYEEYLDDLEYEESRIYKDSPEVGLWYEGTRFEGTDKTHFVWSYNDDGTYNGFTKKDEKEIGEETYWEINDNVDYGEKWRSVEDDIEKNVKEINEDGKYIRIEYKKDKEKYRTEVFENADGRIQKDYFLENELSSTHFKIEEDELPEDLKKELDKKVDVTSFKLVTSTFGRVLYMLF